MSKIVYIAGPLFSEAERRYLEVLVSKVAETTGLNPQDDFFLPHRDGGEFVDDIISSDSPPPEEVFLNDIDHINNASIVVSWLDGQDSDSGTCIELGYAYSQNKKILGLLTDLRGDPADNYMMSRPNLMVWGVYERGTTLFHNIEELSTALRDSII